MYSVKLELTSKETKSKSLFTADVDVVQKDDLLRVISALPPTYVTLQVGEYAIRPFGNGDFWISHENGEGGQIKKADMEELFHKFWREVF